MKLRMGNWVHNKSLQSLLSGETHAYAKNPLVHSLHRLLVKEETQNRTYLATVPLFLTFVTRVWDVEVQRTIELHLKSIIR